MGQNKILISVWESKDRVAIQLNLSLATPLVETLWACLLVLVLYASLNLKTGSSTKRFLFLFCSNHCCWVFYDVNHLLSDYALLQISVMFQFNGPSNCAVSASNTPVQVSTGYSVVFWLASKKALFPKNCIQEFLGWIPVKPRVFRQLLPQSSISIATLD